jgi:HEPN domain-containing protein
MDEVVKKWVTRARYDLSTAEVLLKARKYLYVAFTCQQCLEKMFKAIITKNGKKIVFTHNLSRLAEDSGTDVEMDTDLKKFLVELTPFAIEARYGDYRKRLSELVDKREATRYMEKTKRIFRWLKERLS